MRQITTLLIFILPSFYLLAQTYTVTGFTSPWTFVNGVYSNTGMQNNGVDYYKHNTEEVYLFREDFGTQFWVIACEVSPTANVIYDVVGSTSATPPSSGWTYATITAGSAPVEMTYFKSEFKDHSAYLTWETATEINNKGFEIEFSVDSYNWKRVGFVKGAGYSFDFLEYTFQYDEIKAGNNYFRLKQLDFDGNFEYSEVVSILSVSSENYWKVYPTIVHSCYFSISISQHDFEQGLLYIFDAQGRKIVTTIVNSNESEISIDDYHMPAGSYWVVLDLNGFKHPKKLIVQ